MRNGHHSRSFHLLLCVYYLRKITLGANTLQYVLPLGQKKHIVLKTIMVVIFLLSSDFLRKLAHNIYHISGDFPIANNTDFNIMLSLVLCSSLLFSPYRQFLSSLPHEIYCISCVTKNIIITPKNKIFADITF